MPTLLETKQQQLAEVRAAIAKIVTGAQSYQIGDGVMNRGLQRAKLADLEAREQRLEREVADLEAAATGTGGRITHALMR